MKVLILYSEHDSSKQFAQKAKESMPETVEVIDVINVYGDKTGLILKDLLGVREFPCVIPIMDYMQGQNVSDLDYLDAIICEQRDIDEREFHKKEEAGFLKAKIAFAKDEGREEIKKIVREAVELPEIAQEARKKLEDAGVIPKKRGF